MQTKMDGKEWGNWVKQRLDAPRFIMGALVVGVLIFWSVLVVVIWNIPHRNEPQYQRLFAFLPPRQSDGVRAYLQKNHIPYLVEQETQALEVPSERLFGVRMHLASLGFLHDNHVGFALLDRQMFESTYFGEGLTFHKTIEKELAASIDTLPFVRKSTVSLTIPPLMDQRHLPSALVILSIDEKKKGLTTDAIKGIKDLVAFSVPKLTRERVFVMDTQGLAIDEGDNDVVIEGSLSSAQQRYKTKEERLREEKLISLLAPLVGGRDHLTVHVVLNYEFFGRDGFPITPLARTTTHAQEYAEITGIHVNVVIDGAYELSSTKRLYVGLKHDSYHVLQDLVVSSMGINTARGDRVVIGSFPFQVNDTTGELLTKRDTKMVALIQYTLLLLVVIGIYVKWLIPLSDKCLSLTHQLEEEDDINEIIPMVTLFKEGFLFEEILNVEGEVIQKILSTLDHRIIMIALKSSSVQLKEAFYGVMSPCEKKEFMDAFGCLEAVSIKEVEEAQSLVVEAVLKLC
jgi:flagellar biosynthesis/type III secretory pathway M-ring protein FliF/YscJ